MRRKTLDRRDDKLLEPSPLVRRFASKIVAAAAAKPILDAACGSGRNAMFLSQLGCTIICVDKDLTHLEAQQLRWRSTPLRRASERLVLQHLDLINHRWPFGLRVMGGIVNVHFFLPALLPFFASSLAPGGYLLLETPPGCGGNYLELPKAGEVRRELEKAFDLEFYKEVQAGHCACDAVTVKALARRWHNRPALVAG